MLSVDLIDRCQQQLRRQPSYKTAHKTLNSRHRACALHMLPFAFSDIARAVQHADPTTLLPDQSIDQVAQMQSTADRITIEVSQQLPCLVCHPAVRATVARTCHMLTCGGLGTAQHVPLRCARKKCKARYKLGWAIDQVDTRGLYTWFHRF